MRPARSEDLPVLLEMVSEYHLLDHLPFDAREIEPLLSRLMADPSLGRIWIVEQAQPESIQVAGYLVLFFGYSIEYLGRNAFIDELYLREAFRGCGLGKAALDFVSNQASQLGVRALHLECERQNTKALSLYRKYGFEDPDRVLMTYWP